MQKHAAAHPGVHSKKSWRFHLFDINGLALIKHRESHGHVHYSHQRAHERECHVGDIEIGLGVAAETENLQAEPVTAAFRFAAQVAAQLESSKNVAGGAFGNAQLAADFRVGESVAAVGRSFEDVKRAFDSSDGAGVRDRHGNS